MAELTKITPKDYEGKDCCTVCHKTVGETHQSVSCSSCERWTHRKCTSINRTKYKKLQEVVYFSWFCKNCKTTEIKIPNEIDPLQIQAKDLPDEFSIVKKGKNELSYISTAEV